MALSVVGGAELAGNANERPEVDPPAETLAYQMQLAELERVVDEAADRGSRGTSDADASERTVRAEAAQVKPEPEPEPEPEPAPESASEPAPSDSTGPVPASCSEYSGNRATGCSMLLDAGFGIDQMSCLDNLWTRESGWNHQAQNPSSGAYGIPQSLPGDKMASHGSDWQTNPATQISWGLEYINNRYGNPCGAWGFFQSNNWY
ncbi:lytic transglycosylase domain-containing protein [Natronosporangium hydrolyticum]|uniref:Lytic transglycosylase domain-containing protein n=1 Tax=Natronosporangium hydrolyticum TaxID=2811111 RepID=A0A895YMY1_9ACTN|nr:lytic transglycosylase domain-containing protein [Natronosporangium hydrolyticum]QSB15278.1 lytic transglycosylase domain-containing protein [Natronosporangium hydrolyticum]